MSIRRLDRIGGGGNREARPRVKERDDYSNKAKLKFCDFAMTSAQELAPTYNVCMCRHGRINRDPPL